MATTTQQEPDEKRQIRKRHAVDAFQSAEKRGVRLQDQNALPTILQEYIKASGLPPTWFEVLKPEDWWDLFTRFAIPVKSAGSLDDPPTPPESQDGIDEKGEGAKRPTLGSRRAVTACFCNERESFISEKVISQNGLHSLVGEDKTIRLSWKNCSQPMAKTPCTKFWIPCEGPVKKPSPPEEGKALPRSLITSLLHLWEEYQKEEHPEPPPKRPRSAEGSADMGAGPANKRRKKDDDGG